MSLLTKTLFKYLGCKRLLGCNSICNEVRLCYAQYHTLNSSPKVQYRDFNFDLVIKREVALLSSVKFAYSNFTKLLSNIYTYGFSYLPVFNSSEPRLIGYYWYKSLDEINIEEFFTLFNLPDTFYSRYKVIELHVWMLLCILPQNNRRSRLIKYSVIMAMWEDNETRAKMVQQINKNFKKNMRNLNGKFRMSLLLYDLGLFESDSFLASAVWYNFFDKEDVDPRYLETLVHFIRHQINHLSSLNIEKLGRERDKTGIWLPVKPSMNEIFQKA